jgi:hypothetical protein
LPISFIVAVSEDTEQRAAVEPGGASASSDDGNDWGAASEAAMICE